MHKIVVSVLLPHIKTRKYVRPTGELWPSAPAQAWLRPRFLLKHAAEIPPKLRATDAGKAREQFTKPMALDHGDL